MDAQLIIAFAAVGAACFLAGLFVGSRRGRRDGQMLTQGSPLRADTAALAARQAPPPGAPAPRVAPGSVNLQLGRDLEQLLRAGKKIEAIKIVRERTGLGLKEAKDAVERLEDLMRSRLGGLD